MVLNFYKKEAYVYGQLDIKKCRFYTKNNFKNLEKFRKNLKNLKNKKLKNLKSTWTT